VLEHIVRDHRKEKDLQKDQTVLEMAQKVLARQAKALVAQTEQPFDSALEAVASTDAGCRLVHLANGEHRHEKAAEWQARLPWKRAEERHYSSRIDRYMRQLEGEEDRAEYYALLEELASLRG